MALGFSSQTSPFKPSYCPPYFFFCKSCSGLSSIATSLSSSRCLWASSKLALYRREASKSALFGSSQHFEQCPSYISMALSRKYKADDPDSYCSTSDLNLDKRGCSTLSTIAHRLPNGNSRFSWHRARENIKESKVRYDLKKFDLRYTSKESNEKVAHAKHTGIQNGSAYKNGSVSSSPSYPEYGSNRRQSDLGNLYCRGYINNLQTQNPPCKISSGNQTCIVSNNDMMSLGSELKNQDSILAYVPDACHLENNETTNSYLVDKSKPSYGDTAFKSFAEKPLKEKQETISKRVGINAIAQDFMTDKNFVTSSEDVIESHIENISPNEAIDQPLLQARLCRIIDKVLVVNNVSLAREVVNLLTKQYRHLVHACDTEVSNIDVKQETPVDHGEITCFSIYSGPDADFGNGKSCIWVDVLDGGGRNLLAEFAPFFEDPSIKKVWHNYSFDNHVIQNYGFKLSGFHADTMHMARLWDSSRRTDGGYSLEALTCDSRVMSVDSSFLDGELIGKVSMKTIFGRRKVKKDGSEGKVFIIPPVEELQRAERRLWVCYSSLDSISTLKLYESLKDKLCGMDWNLDGVKYGSMFLFYERYWRPFGQLLVTMESEGMLVDRAYLAEIEKVAKLEQHSAADRFRNWASKYCPDAKHMNVGSDAQLRQLFFGGIQNRKNYDESLPIERKFKVPNIDKVIEEGRKTPLKNRTITLYSVGVDIKAEIFTATGWPSVSGDALKTLSGKVSAEYDFTEEADWLLCDENATDSLETLNDRPPKETKGSRNGKPDASAYGTAYAAFGGGRIGVEACHAIAALCEVCSIDSLISNFILPLQGNHVSGKNGRIHCSLNINTETGRLSARRPNLQNQPALEKDRYKIRQAFIAAPGNSLIVADYGQLELRILAHLANCKSMLEAFKAGGDFHSRTALNMYPHIWEAVENKHVLLEWHPQPGEDKPPVPLLKDAFASERRKAKMLNFSIAYGKTSVGLARDWKVSVAEAEETVSLWYSDRKEVLSWQKERKKEAREKKCVHTLLGRARRFPSLDNATAAHRAHIERAAINTPVQGSAADVAMCAMLEISKNARLKELGWRLLLQVHDEVILEGPTESAEAAKAIVVECMSKPFDGKNILRVDLSVDAKCAHNWYSAK